MALEKSRLSPPAPPAVHAARPTDNYVAPQDDRNKYYRVGPWGLLAPNSKWVNRLDRTFLGVSSSENVITKTYLVLSLLINNHSDDPLKRPDLRLTDDSGRTFLPSYDGAGARDSYFQIDEINPGVMADGVAVFKVPDDGQYWLNIDGEGSIPVVPR